MKMTRLPCFTLLFLLLFASSAWAVTNARDYIPNPAGTKMLILYGNHSFGDDLYHDGDKVRGDANFSSSIGIIRPIYYTKIGPFTANPQAIIPFGNVGLFDTHSSGLGDITLAATIWFIDDKVNNFYFGYTPYLTLPTGRYHRNEPLNLGSNQWSTKHEIGMGKRFGDALWLEGMAGVEFYFDNDDALDKAGNKATLSKDPLFNLDLHLSYDLTERLVGSVDYYLLYGAETELGNVNQNNEKITHTLGCSLFYMLTKQTQLMLEYKRDVSVENGVKANTLQGRVAFIF
ncbi:MAG: transporter [Desulfobulbus sp.]|jgi:hypothetical protein